MRFILILSFLLTGCITNPIIKTEDQVVKISVPVPCKIKVVEKPEMIADTLKKTDPLDTKVAKLTAERERRKAYEKEMEAAVKECQ